MVLAIDFDGTVVTHEYPNVGQEVPNAKRVLQRLIDAGHKLILWTMRDKDELEQAKEWFDDRDLILYGVQKNPTQAHWTTSRKCYANLYIDDAALGCPLIKGQHAKAYADWNKIEQLLIEEGYLTKE